MFRLRHCLLMRAVEHVNLGDNLILILFVDYKWKIEVRKVKERGQNKIYVCLRSRAATKKITVGSIFSFYLKWCKMNKCVPYLSYSYTKSLFAHIMQDILQIRLIRDCL